MAAVKIESLAIRLRKRSPSEAIDLGFRMARHWFLRLWGAWFIAALPIFAIALAVNWYFDTWYGSILLWWCKPLYEQPLLYILSRETFSQHVSIKYVFNNYRQIVKPQLFALLSWRRFSPSRSFNNPVAMLEGLKGKKRQQRLTVLHAHQSNASQWLTIVCMHLEVFLQIAILAFIYSLIPQTVTEEFNLFQFITSEERSFDFLSDAMYFLAASVFAPFYVAAGFSLYLARRTVLEGWDIELVFKQLQGRIKEGFAKVSAVAVVPFLACAIVLSMVTTDPALAGQDVDVSSAKVTIEKVMEHEDFGKKIVKKKLTYIGESEKDDETESSQWLKDFFEWLFGDADIGALEGIYQVLEVIIWLILVGFVVLLVVRYAHILPWLDFSKKSLPEVGGSTPEVLMGLKVSEESIPDNVIEVVAELLSQKQYREAIALLYRASLSKVVHQGDIEIPASATEQECNRLIRRSRPQEEARYFDRLTRVWTLLAYGNRLPADEVYSSLLADWPQFYGKQA